MPVTQAPCSHHTGILVFFVLQDLARIRRSALRYVLVPLRGVPLRKANLQFSPKKGNLEIAMSPECGQTTLSDLHREPLCQPSTGLTLGPGTWGPLSAQVQPLFCSSPYPTLSTCLREQHAVHLEASHSTSLLKTGSDFP